MIQVVNVSSFSRIVYGHMTGVVVNVLIGEDSFGVFISEVSWPRLTVVWQ